MDVCVHEFKCVCVCVCWGEMILLHRSCGGTVMGEFKVLFFQEHVAGIERVNGIQPGKPPQIFCISLTAQR